MGEKHGRGLHGNYISSDTTTRGRGYTNLDRFSIIYIHGEISLQQLVKHNTGGCEGVRTTLEFKGHAISYVFCVEGIIR